MMLTLQIAVGLWLGLLFFSATGALYFAAAEWCERAARRRRMGFKHWWRA